jgi:hypothetical protein
VTLAAAVEIDCFVVAALVLCLGFAEPLASGPIPASLPISVSLSSSASTKESDSQCSSSRAAGG